MLDKMHWVHPPPTPIDYLLNFWDGRYIRILGSFAVLTTKVFRKQFAINKQLPTENGWMWKLITCTGFWAHYWVYFRGAAIYTVLVTCYPLPLPFVAHAFRPFVGLFFGVVFGFLVLVCCGPNFNLLGYSFNCQTMNKVNLKYFTTHVMLSMEKFGSSPPPIISCLLWFIHSRTLPRTYSEQ